jgi:serine/threonine-protein kinase
MQRPTRYPTLSGVTTSSHTPSGSDLGRFAPGTVLQERYRVVGLLGRGGMGEVYRAEDLTLGQPVALKFLTETLSGNEEFRERFLSEVRMAREVSHSSVCRVFDVGEVDGQIFLSMEYIDGEDLASLLRRVGRLPSEKALETARQFCAGLAAVHDRGIIHRDLKPANLMLDGRGVVRLTDFGLASALTGDLSEGFAGTPFYMAPELTQGGTPSVRSDVYALGLILYEIFTGRPAITGKSLAEVVKAHQAHQPAAPTSLVADLDPDIEAVIERCIEKDPKRRFSSALAVSAALPGGDPLAEALARGDTPSLETVAASGGTGALRPAVAWGWLALISLCALALCWAGPRVSFSGLIPLDLPPDVLEHRAREMLDGELGYTRRQGDSWDWNQVHTVRGFERNYPYRQWLRAAQVSHGETAIPAGDLPPAYTFWYRAAQSPIYSRDPNAFVTSWNPEVGRRPEVVLDLTPDGNLHYFAAYWGNWSPHEEGTDFENDAWAPPAPRDPSSVNGDDLLRLGGFDPEAMRPIRASWFSRVPVDFRLAWSGPAPGNFADGQVPPEVHVEAGFRDGWPSSFVVFDPRPPQEAFEVSTTAFERILASLQSNVMPVLIIGILLIAPIIMLRSFRQRSGDRRGAARLAWFVVITFTLHWVLRTQLMSDVQQDFWRFCFALGRSLLFGGICWTLYLGLEPHVRRVWPHMLVGWSRALSGHWRDPMVARDILVGLSLGLLLSVVEPLAALLCTLYGAPLLRPLDTGMSILGGLPVVLSDLLNILGYAIRMVLVGVFMIALLRTLLRSRLAAVLIAGLIGMVAMPLQANFGSAGTDLAISGLKMAIWCFAAVRFGVLAVLMVQVVYMISFDWPLTLDLSAWHATPSIVFLLLVAGTAALTFNTACRRSGGASGAT